MGKVTNMQGELCMTYPPELLIVEAALGGRMAGKAEAEEEEEEDEEAVLVPPPPPPTEGTKARACCFILFVYRAPFGLAVTTTHAHCNTQGPRCRSR